MRHEIESQMLRMKESLFTSKFTPDPDSYMNAYSGGDWDTYAMGYKRAGDILVQYVADNDWDQDFLVYPITFLYRQYLELRLKELSGLHCVIGILRYHKSMSSFTLETSPPKY